MQVKSKEGMGLEYISTYHEVYMYKPRILSKSFQCQGKFLNRSEFQTIYSVASVVTEARKRQIPERKVKPFFPDIA